MDTTHFLMLLFVFWTLWQLINKNKLPADKHERIGAVAGRLVWALLGTFFFHHML